tara:strand:- start:2865 stop:3551 length:687 start_codon:yes stop_codon:yes gene_type:complete
MSNKTLEHVRASAKKAKGNNLTLHGRPVFLNTAEPLPDSIDLQGVIEKVQSLIPSHLFKDLDVVYVGDFDFFKDTNTNAAWQSGAIYLSNKQDNNEDLTDDIVHELAHAVESAYPTMIYADGRLEDDFLFRRNTLKSVLKSHDYDVASYDFLEVEYSKEFDNFLYEIVGYPVLNVLTEGLFCSAYGVTSLKEYWANGFEEYFLGDRKYLYNTSKVLYNKINDLVYYKD